MLKEDITILPLIYDNSFKHIFLDKPEMLMTIISKIIDYPFDPNIDVVEVCNGVIIKQKLKEKGYIADIVLMVNKFDIISIEANKGDFSWLKAERNFIYITEIGNRHKRHIHKVYNNKNNKSSKNNSKSNNKNKNNNNSNTKSPQVIQVNLNYKSSVFGAEPIIKNEVRNKIYNRALIKNFTIWLINVDKCQEMMYTNDEMSKEHLLSAVFATSSANELELLLIKGGVDKNMTRDFIEFIKEKNNDTSYLNDLVTVHPIEEKIDEAYSDGHAMGIDEGERIGYARGEEIGVAKGVKQGIEQGREEGREQGREEGRKQGREEGRNESTQNIINKLIEKGLSDNEISNLLDINHKQITKLKRVA